MRGEPLSGGRNAAEVVWAGDTILRAREPGREFAARLLRYLESAGYPYAPRRAWAEEAVRWATADQHLTRAIEPHLLAALR